MKSQQGVIALMHVSSNPDDHSTLDADALTSIIAGYRAKGYQFVNLDLLVAARPAARKVFGPQHQGLGMCRVRRQADDHWGMQARVVVGISPASGSAAAADYAAALASRHRAGLHLISVMDHRSPRTMPGIAMLDRVAERLRTAHSTLDLTTDAALGDPATVLAAESAGVFATVVGASPDRGSRGPRPTSIPARLAAHGHGAIVVVHPGGLASGPVLVGVDGSGSARGAVAYAVGEAVALRVSLMALNVCPEVDPDAEAILAQALAPWREKFPGLRVVTRVVLSSSPEYVLPDQSQHAALTVAGSRGHGGYPALLLGSVSQLLVRDGVGAVAIVHGA